MQNRKWLWAAIFFFWNHHSQNCVRLDSWLTNNIYTKWKCHKMCLVSRFGPPNVLIHLNKSSECNFIISLALFTFLWQFCHITQSWIYRKAYSWHCALNSNMGWLHSGPIWPRAPLPDNDEYCFMEWCYEGLLILTCVSQARDANGLLLSRLLNGCCLCKQRWKIRWCHSCLSNFTGLIC